MGRQGVAEWSSPAPTGSRDRTRQALGSAAAQGGSRSVSPTAAVTVAVCLAAACAFLVLAVWLAGPGSTRDTPVATGRPPAPPGIEGLAASVVDEWFTASGDSETPARTVAVIPDGHDRWTATVATGRPGVQSHLAVSLVATPAGGVDVAGGPWPVPAPPTPLRPAAAELLTLPTAHPLSQAAVDVATAYLAGRDLTPWLAPGVQAAAITGRADGTPFRVEEVLVSGPAAETPDDGAVTTITVVAVLPDSRIPPVEVPMTMTGFDGRWHLLRLPGATTAVADMSASRREGM